jgi:hypothetical protein
MLGVQTRRRLAIALVAAFVVISCAITFAAVHYYRPQTLEKRAEAEFSAAFPCALSLGDASVSLRDEVTFASASLSLDNREFLTAGAATVKGLPKPIEGWRPVGIELSDVKLLIDLDSPERGMGGVKALDGVLNRTGRSRASLGGPVEVVISREGKDIRYTASPADLLAGRPLHLAPVGHSAPADWALTLTSDSLTLRAPVRKTGDEVSDAVLRDAATGLLSKAENAQDGYVTATWTADYEAFDFDDAKGWRIGDAALRGIFASLPPGAATLDVTAFSVEDGEVTDLDASFEYSGKQVKSDEVSRWLALVDLPALPKETPSELESASASGTLALRKGLISLKSLPGTPGLLWTQAGAVTTKRAPDAIEIPLRDFRANLGKIKSR